MDDSCVDDVPVEKLFEAELRAYEANRDALLRDFESEFVLIKGNEIAGTYVSKTDAVREGYKRFGNVPFLVKEIVQFEESIFLPSSLMQS